MIEYKHVLFVTDLREDCDVVLERAKYILKMSDGSRLSLLHIVEETVLTAGYEIVPIVPADNESELTLHAKQQIRALLASHHLEASIHVDSALSTRRGILDYVKKNQPDLLVIGRHKRTGLSSLLGSTADDILPSVPCDVLVVQLGEPV